MNMTVVGLGKIGLPLAVQFALKGTRVFGADVNSETVDLVNRGIEPFPEEADLQEKLNQVISEELLTASTDTSTCVSKSSTVIVVVPLFVNDDAEPDFRALDAATDDIGRGLQPGTLVSYETTLPIGTTRNRFTRALEKISGLKVGVDFYVTFSPERVLTGRVFSDLRKYPKILGGVTSACSQVGREFYAKHLDFDPRPDLPEGNGVWVVGTSEAAEFVKIAETTYRDVNIGLANQFAKFASKLNIDIDEVIYASNSQYYSNIHKPGISVGGHCIPIYPQFYLWQDPDATIVRAAREVNDSMPRFIVQRISTELGSLHGKNVLVLGVSYRPGVKESAFSGIFPVVNELEKQGAKVFVDDPYYTSMEIESLGLNPYFNKDDVEIIVIHTHHSSYTEKYFIQFKKSAKIFQRDTNFFSVKSKTVKVNHPISRDAI